MKITRSPLYRATALIILVAWACAFAALSPATSHAGDETKLYLRRATFDPRARVPASTIAPAAQHNSALQLVQLNAPPDAGTRARLEAAGLRPLAYVPDNAYLVRVVAADQHALSAAWVRWSGAFEPAYKLAPDLDAALARGDGMLDLRLHTAPDRAAGPLAAAIEQAGGSVLAHSAEGRGGLLRARVPVRALVALLQRDDLIWVERYIAPQISNDRARAILGVDQAYQTFGLDGSGQIVAVTDTGLDLQATVESGGNPDFPSERIAAGFTKFDMGGTGCLNNWNDNNGHGTHVAGTIAGSGALSPSPLSFAGVAPEARLVIQAVSNGGSALDCLPFDTSYIESAYAAGARIHNASFGAPSGSEPNPYGGYTSEAAEVDRFLWEHPEYLFVVAAGNQGLDDNADGVIDPDSINTPATAKNVVTVGASENDRPPLGSSCNFFPEDCRWDAYWYVAWPLSSDYISDNPNGMAAFSSRGPTDDGRIKPEIVAPGVNIISAASHVAGVSYDAWYTNDYAYLSGTSMATPMISGMAALVRQWLAEQHYLTTPSAALVKALLLNGAVDMSPGQYGTGNTREIPADWPNNVQGWGRAVMTDTIGLGGEDRVWMADQATGGLQTGEELSYPLYVEAGQPLRVTLVWSDYPGTPFAGRALVNNLDLELVLPDGSVLRGNNTAELPSDCRTAEGADRCNNVESVEVEAPVAGKYTVRVRGSSVAIGPQPFALAARAQSVVSATTPAAPTLASNTATGSPFIDLVWDDVAGATYYQVHQSDDGSFGAGTQVTTTTTRRYSLIADLGSYYFRVRACNLGGCGEASNIVAITVTAAPDRVFLPRLYSQ